MVLPTWDWIGKTVHGVETHWFSNREVLGEVVSKEGHADCLQGHERTLHYWFPWKRYD